MKKIGMKSLSIVLMLPFLMNNMSAAITKKVKMSESTITKLPSGLGYQILTEAPSGAKAVQNQQTVTVHYTGWLDVNGQPGQKFDSSVDRGQPFSFALGVGGVISGWDQGVLNMKVGEKRRLFIPSALGYGARGAGASIPPHANLIFDVEVLKIS